MTTLGSETRPLRVAIVGSGPSGFYAAEALFKSDINTSVTMFERLPTPFGLLRGGVAPDHQRMKSVSKAYDRIATNPNFSFKGNVTIGQDITVEELQTFYDVVIFACGAETDKKLGIPGEALPGSHTATEFVGWYNGHPDYQSRAFALKDAKRVAIIGQGNVAIDVTRILAKTTEELSTSDIAQSALDELAQSGVEEIYLIGRRGPVQAAFTELEIKELGVLEDADPVVSEKDMALSEADSTELDGEGNGKARKNVAILKEFADRSGGTKSKKIVVRFFQSPVRIEGTDRVESIVLERNELSGEPGKQKAKGTGDTETLPVDLVFRSVGYRGLPLEGVPFHESWGVFPNDLGRIEGANQLYVTGWIKRGPSGVIGTNRGDSKETVATILEDLITLTPCNTPDQSELDQLLASRDVRVVTFADWQKIDAKEISRGEEVGKPREKITSIEEMFAVLDN
ncbi:FAD-dependent oxidoreductase [bacterium]|jgi:ferredoxin/flavodoxin---NADP+ reductase|nr:FAD-dependent oxidoreductase [bacterium]